jgi:hypothetical protein
VKTIANYRIPSYILKGLLRIKNKPFADIPVRTEQEETEFSEGEIKIEKNPGFKSFNYNIIKLYLDNSALILDEELLDDDEKKVFYVWLADFLSQSCTDSEVFMANRLYSNALVWTIIKDIVAPMYNKLPKNIKVLNCAVDSADISQYVEKSDEENEEFIFVNRNVSHNPFIDAAVLLEAIKSLGLNCCSVIRKIWFSEVKELFEEAVKFHYLEDDEIIDFFHILLTFANIDNKFEMTMKMQKEAQHRWNWDKATPDRVGMGADGYLSNWHYMGLLEKMLAPVRDRKENQKPTREPYVQQMLDKINLQRRKEGRDGLTYEALLKIHNEGKQISDVVLEKLLQSDRIW